MPAFKTLETNSLGKIWVNFNFGYNTFIIDNRVIHLFDLLQSSNKKKEKR